MKLYCSIALLAVTLMVAAAPAHADDQPLSFPTTQSANLWLEKFRESKNLFTNDELEAIKKYQRAGYQKINKYLRFGKGDESVQMQVKLLDTAMTHLKTPTAIIVHRGFALEGIPQGDQQPPNSTFLEKAFASTSLDRSVAANFALGSTLDQEKVAKEMKEALEKFKQENNITGKPSKEQNKKFMDQWTTLFVKKMDKFSQGAVLAEIEVPAGSCAATTFEKTSITEREVELTLPRNTTFAVLDPPRALTKDELKATFEKPQIKTINDSFKQTKLKGKKLKESKKKALKGLSRRFSKLVGKLYTVKLRAATPCAVSSP